MQRLKSLVEHMVCLATIRDGVFHAPASVGAFFIIGVIFMEENNSNNENKQIEKENGKETKGKTNPWTIVIVIFIIAYVIFITVWVTREVMLSTNETSEAKSSSGAINTTTTTTITPKLFTRDANSGDIVVDSELDFSSLGAKFVITPQRDIDGLKIEINFLDKNKETLYTKKKTLGNVTKGVQVSFSISLFDLDITTVFKTEYTSISVTAGTVSWFS